MDNKSWESLLKMGSHLKIVSMGWKFSNSTMFQLKNGKVVEEKLESIIWN